MIGFGVEPLDRRHFFPVTAATGVTPSGRAGRPRDRAGAALGDAAAEFVPVRPSFLADGPQKRHVRVGVNVLLCR